MPPASASKRKSVKHEVTEADVRETAVSLAEHIHNSMRAGKKAGLLNGVEQRMLNRAYTKAATRLAKAAARGRL